MIKGVSQIYGVYYGYLKEREIGSGGKAVFLVVYLQRSLFLAIIYYMSCYGECNIL